MTNNTTDSDQSQSYRVKYEDVRLGTLLVSYGTHAPIAKGTIVRVLQDNNGATFVGHKINGEFAVVPLISTEIDGVHYYEGYKLADLLIYDKL